MLMDCGDHVALMNLVKAGEMLGLDLPALKFAFDKSKTNTGEWNDAVLRFLEEAFKIKNEMVYYLTIEILSKPYNEACWYHYYYKISDISEIDRLQKMIGD